MELLLVRHAVAVPRSDDLPDPDRPLTDRGVRRFSRSVEGLRRLDLELDDILHSPWLRAAQTARLLSVITEGAIHASANLAAAPGEALLAELAGFAEDGRHALVGHEPWMNQLLAWLVTGNAGLGENLAFKKGGVAWLEGEPRPSGMILRAMLPPRTLRCLGGGKD
jgi:phosphohistidine phosphatase